MNHSTAGLGAHHTRITEFPPALIAATDALFSSYAWRGDTAAKQTKAQKWVNAASEIFGIEAPQVLIVTDAPVGSDGYGLYNRASNVIALPKMSVISLFHFFRYAIQTSALDVEILRPAFNGNRGQEDAAAFSTSLFHQVRPALFREAVMRPDLTVCFVRPSDLDPVAA